MNLVLDYNPNTLNLESRENKIMGLKEGFSYDNLDRLTDVRIVNGKHTSTVYEDNGNIKTKTDVGTYAYDANKINVVKNITAPVNQSDISTLNQDITYTSFNKVKTIKENDYEITYHYGADFQRKKAELKYQNQLQYTKYYHGNFEKIVEASGKTTEVTQVNSLNGNVAVHVKTTQNNQINNNVYFVYTDQLGSPLVLTNNTGDIVYEQSFDAWGLILRGSFALWQNGKLGLSNSLKKSPNNWNDYENIPETPTWLRGYTGHEHLLEFDLINMNGRVYDPLIGRMLSPDNFIQSPGFSQSYNRYAYVWNNPLKYSDPSGEAVHFLIPAAIGFATGYLSHGLTTGKWGMSAVGAGAIGSGMAILGFYAGGASSAANITKAFSSVSASHGITSALGYSGRYAVSALASSFMPSYSIPITNNFTLNISTGIGFGSNGFNAGFHFSGTYTNGSNSFTYGRGYGNNYKAWGISAKFNNGGLGLGYNRIYYGNEIGPDGMSNNQIVGGISISSHSFAFRLENDFAGDRNDRWRSNAFELSFFNGALTFGTNLYNNEVNRDVDPNFEGKDLLGNKHRNKDYGAWFDGETYYSNAWIGLSNGNTITRAGFSSPYVQDRTQNVVHNWGPPGIRTNFFNNYNNFQRGAYTYSGYHNPYSLW